MREQFLNMLAPGLCSLSPYVPGKPESELRRELGLEEIIKLASNENPIGCSPLAHKAMQAVMPEIARYPDGSAHELKQRLAEFHRLPAECITMGNGSNDVLVLLSEAFLQAGVSAVFSQYSFAVYALATQAVNAISKMVPALPADDMHMPLGHDLQAMLDAVDDSSRIVFLANPNNPTGTWIEPDDILAFLKELPDHVLLVVDEAYAEYNNDQSLVSYLGEHPQLVITRTFSKAYGLAGLRVGYALSHPDVAEVLNRIRQPFNVNSVALAAAEAALADQAFIEQCRTSNNKLLMEADEKLKALGYKTIPSRGNFVLMDCLHPAASLFEHMLKQGFIIRPVANYGLPNHLRISIGSDEEMRAFFSKLPAMGTRL